MEKVEYSWESFYKEVASWKCFSSRTAEMFLNDDFVYKMFNSSMLLKRRKEANIDLIAGLDEKLLTIPDRKVYIDGVYQGFRMKNGGIPLLKYIIDNQVSFDGKIEILYKIKNIVKYLDELGIIHGDLRLPNFLIKDGIIRLTDLNNMLLHDGDDAEDITDLHNDWYETLDTALLLDNLAFIC